MGPVLTIGIESFKIEGRLKSAAYVAATTQAYHNTIFGSSATDSAHDLEKVYSRGFFSGWLHGVDHQQLVRGDYSSHFGLEIGTVVSKSKTSVRISSNQILKSGQGLLFFDPLKQQRMGSPIYAVKKLSERLFDIELDHEIDLEQISSKMLVFVNSDPELDRELQKTFTDRSRFKKVDLLAKLSGELGRHLELELQDDLGNCIKTASEEYLETAKSTPLSETQCQMEISALTNTPFRISKFDCAIPINSYISQRSIRKLKQKAIQALSQIRISRPKVIFNNFELSNLQDSKGSKQILQESPKLSILIREEEQLQILPFVPANTIIYLDFEYGKRYEAAIAQIRAQNCLAGIATTRILKPQEAGHLRYIQRLDPDLVLVRNLGALEFLKSSGMRLIGDFSLNICNSLTAAWMLDQGLSRITPAYDLNSTQLKDLIHASSASTFEVTIHQYMPAFHMEHCVYAAFLSKGSSWRDCGKPCEKHRVELRDSKGKLHPLKADAECRNTMFNGEAQSAALLVSDLKKLGVNNFRFEALFEDPEQLKLKVLAYLKFLNSEISIEVLKQATAIEEKYGVSEGQLLSIRNYKDRKKDGGYERPRQVSEIFDRI